MKKRNKQIEQTIKKDVRDHTPDILESIDFNEAFTPAPAKPSIFKRKLPYGFLASFAVIVVVLIAITGPGPLDPGNGDDPDPTFELSTKEEYYSFGAFSAITLLDQALSDNGAVNNTLVTTLSSHDNTLIEAHLGSVNGYVNMVEATIMQRERLTFQLQLSPLDNYTYRVQFSGVNLNGESYIRTLHYNETKVDDGEYEIDGIMTINNITYRVSGEIEIDEDDMEMTLVARHPNNDETYITIHQSIESDEQTLEYEFVRNGDTIFESEVEIEFDEDEIVTEITHETLNVEIELTIIRSLTNGSDALIIEYEIDTETYGDEEGIIVLNVIYDEDQGLYLYEYVISIDEGPTFTVYKSRQYQDSN